MIMIFGKKKKVPITEKDIIWCKDILSKYEPLPEETMPMIFDENLALYLNGIITSETYEHYKQLREENLHRESASKAKRMLETGWKYEMV